MMTHSSLDSGPLVRSLDRFAHICGEVLWVLPLLLIALQFAVVVMVYAFQIGSIQLQESLRYVNALMILGGAGYTLAHDEHVRVDIVYSNLSDRGRALVTVAGTLGLLFPFIGLFFYSAVPYALSSWMILETSVEASGLPVVYILKSTLLLFPLTLLAAGLRDLVVALRVVKGAGA